MRRSRERETETEREIDFGKRKFKTIGLQNDRWDM